tara:strand:+ start:540 stop:656 length:117 start_codon:yes stop_codon:yes gene_type:complete
MGVSVPTNLVVGCDQWDIKMPGQRHYDAIGGILVELTR